MSGSVVIDRTSIWVINIKYYWQFHYINEYAVDSTRFFSNLLLRIWQCQSHWFRHIYRQKDERTNVFTNDTNVVGDRQVPIINHSRSSSQGTDAEVIEANETFLRLKEAQRKALNDPVASSTRVNTSRRIFLPLDCNDKLLWEVEVFLIFPDYPSVDLTACDQTAFLSNLKRSC